MRSRNHVIDSYVDYLVAIADKFKYCEDKTVLEIGPFNGYHTELIKRFNPKNITMIEPNYRAAKWLKKEYPECHVIIDDAILYLCDKPYVKKPYDVVICCGVLYHLHSPVFLLELIANICQPEYVFLETMDSKSNEQMDPVSLPVNFQLENDNTPGNRYTSIGFDKTANLI